ncbi:MAG: hypothetical protein JKX72_04855 [Robiginitomaculum sp.]|nr:hypothetical protein [Robiginitomaculum sp.]
MSRARNVGHEISEGHCPSVEIDTSGKGKCGKCNAFQDICTLTFVDNINWPFKHLRKYVTLCGGCRDVLKRGNLREIRSAKHNKAVLQGLIDEGREPTPHHCSLKTKPSVEDRPVPEYVFVRALGLTSEAAVLRKTIKLKST